MISYFLAAGASEPFGYPVTKTFQERLALELVSKFENNHDSLVSEQRILITILKHKTYPDIEYVFQFFKEMTKMTKLCPLVAEFFRSYTLGGTIEALPTPQFSQGVETKNYLEYNDTLDSFVTSKIYEYYSWNEQNIEKADRIYSKLLQLSDQTQTNIFTTNYDSIIEGYCKESERHYDLVDGFEYDASSRFNKWNASTFDQETNLDTICLFKLHGSLNWKRHRKYGIVKLEDIERVMKNEGQYIDDLLIRPTLTPKEEEQDEPFKTLMDKFKETIVKSTTCIVVGYSFRDQGINDVFSGFMKQGGKLIIISPDVTKEFTENFIAKYHPNEAGYILLDVKLTVDGIVGLIEEIKSHLP